MRSNSQLLLLCLITLATHAQDDGTPSLNIGDPAPPLRVREWINGAQVQRFEKGNIYVVEFWATWCKPCIAEIPHLSALAVEYKDRVTILGIDIMEKKTTSVEKVMAFVDSMGHRKDYHVAAEDSNFMVTGWLDASGERGIPKSFVINAEGRVAWIGHPHQLDKVLPKIVDKTWDIKEALAERNLKKQLEQLDKEAAYELARYHEDPLKPDDPGKPDSILFVINEIVKDNPRLKYMPAIAANTFTSLLKTNPHKACEYGKEMMGASTYEDPLEYIIFGQIKWYSDKLKLPAEIYQLGAEAYRVRIDAYPETADLPRFYHVMAEFYGRANDKSQAIATEQKAIEALKSKKGFSANALAAFESRLRQYRKM
jgi:thiol-disulfide isomerase/thioredoxin